jgi:hypothetical protein
MLEKCLVSLPRDNSRADGQDGLLAEAHLRNTLVPAYTESKSANHSAITQGELGMLSSRIRPKGSRTADETTDTDGSGKGTTARLVGAVEPVGLRIG